ncbi:MAG: aminoglycoside phosphotransferase family protein [Bacteroidetes bacterium]|nr:aminoglycoside phosphotransferase family protein [Bacteroidota bacterium]
MADNKLTEYQLSDLVSKFNIDAQIASIKPFGSGHINDTYRIYNADAEGHDYLLQRINHYVFKNVPLLMSNIVHVTEHLKQKLSSLPKDEIERMVLTVIETKDRYPYFKDAAGNYWRMFYFLKGTKSYDQVTNEKQAFEGGKAFGAFQALLSDMDVSRIKDTIPNFHDIEYRLNNLHNAIRSDKLHRVQYVSEEISFIENRSADMGEIMRLGKAGILPLRIVHNDTKFNNVLLDSGDKAQCVIDLDTVMPGYVAYDFGDSIRTIINTAAEDEADTAMIGLNISLFEAYAKGYLQAAAGFITEQEINSLIKGVLLLPYIQAVRFLTDYLEGDVYFKIHTPGHNLQRAGAQLALVKRLESSKEKLEEIIINNWNKVK